jgi:hypothetical protein
MLSQSPVSPSTSSMTQNPYMARGQGGSQNKGRFNLVRSLTQLFGYRRTSPSRAPSVDNIEFTKVDANSPMRIAQAKMGKTFSTKLVGKLDELFDAWLRDTTDTYKILEDRNKRISELEFAINNDPFLSMAGDMYADEATQIDVQGKLIDIECADIRMKERMEDLLEQWGVTQNRLRSVAYNLACYGDAFWANKVTKNGIVRITPIGIHQVKERLEFNPVQVQTDISLRKGYITAINRSAKLQALFDTMENEEHEEFGDLFDTRLFGFAIDDDMVVPPWSITHFRLNADQSEFAPMGRPFFLKALAPFRQCNATMVLQSLARVMSFPVTVYTVKTAPGMDEALQFEKINQVREEYDNIGDSGAGTEAFSVNTKIWAPEGLLSLEMHTPDIDISATEDIEMYQDRVAIASGIPKGYLVQEWGGFGNSAISLVEQYKPFARRVFTVQSAILDGLSNLFRLHFAITGEFDYREPFVLSMKFPNEESSDLRMAAKQASLNLSKDVLETIATIVGAINDPLPPEVIQDILTKFSFLDQDDIKKWVKYNPNKVEHKEQTPEEFGQGEGGEGGLEGLGGEGGPVGEGAPMGGEGEAGEGEMPGPEEGGMPAATGGEEEVSEIEDEIQKAPERESYERMERSILREARKTSILKRFTESRDIIYEKIIKEFSKIDEAAMRHRHYKYSRIESCWEPTYRLFQKSTKKTMPSASSMSLNEEVDTGQLSWVQIKEQMHREDLQGVPVRGEVVETEPDEDPISEAKKEYPQYTIPGQDDDEEDYPTVEDDAVRQSNIMNIIEDTSPTGNH